MKRGAFFLLLFTPFHLNALTFIDGDLSSIPVISNSSTFNSDDSFVLTKSPGIYSLLLNDLKAGSFNQSKAGEKLLFENSSNNDLSLELAKADALSSQNSQMVNLKKAGYIPLVGDRQSKFQIDEVGDYEVWIKLFENDSQLIEGIKIDNLVLTYSQNERGNSWFRVGAGDLKQGFHSIEILISVKDYITKIRHKDVREVVVISRKNHQEFLDQLKNARSTIYVSKDNESNLINNNFYVPSDGKYHFSVMLKPRLKPIPANILKVNFQEPSSDWQSLTLNKNLQFSPAVLFGKGFDIPRKFFYPMQEGMWRKMGDKGTILILNPYKEPILMDLELNIRTFYVGRKLEIYINGIRKNEISIPSPANIPSQTIVKNLHDIRSVGVVCGVPVQYSEKSVELNPGINEISIIATPGSIILNDIEPFSVAIESNIKTSFQIKNQQFSWKNPPNFNLSFQNGSMIINDTFQKNGTEISWIPKKLERINLNDYSKLFINYSWHNHLQDMDIGFKIETGNSDQPNYYFVRTLPRPLFDEGKFELDLLEALREEYSGALNPTLVGIDFFPHKKWGEDSSLHEGSEVDYLIHFIEIGSRHSSMTQLTSENLTSVRVSGPSNQVNLEQHKNSLSLTMSLGGNKPVVVVSELRIALKQRPTTFTQMTLPFKYQNSKAQDLKGFLGIDKDNDGKTDIEVPLGNKRLLSRWKLLSQDPNSETTIYQTEAPNELEDNLANEIPFFNCIITKDGKPLSFTSDMEILKIREVVYYKQGKINLSVPRNRHPNDFRYEIYITPKIELSSIIPGYLELPIDMRGPLLHIGNPVELILKLEAQLPEKIHNETSYAFDIKSPQYVKTKLLKVEDLMTQEIPSIEIDGIEAPLRERRLATDQGGVFIEGDVSLSEGSHYLKVGETLPLDTKFVEIQFANNLSVPVIPKPVSYKLTKVNPTKYLADFVSDGDSFNLILDQNYHSLWSAYIDIPGKQRIYLSDHFEINGYANGWRVPKNLIPNGERGRIVMEYTSQKFMYVGVFVSLFTLFSCLLFSIYSFFISRKN